MKKLLLSSVLSLLFATLGIGQALKMEKAKAPKMECHLPVGVQTGVHFIDAPKEYYARIQGRTEANTCQINVTYNNFPPAAQKAFQSAVDVWQTLLVSDVPINVVANWTNLGANVLGSAAPTNIYRNFVGAARANTWYCVATAEKMAHKNLNGTDADIVANFNSAFNWYTGASGIPARNQQDLFTIVLHELGHGLGFFTFSTVSGNTGGYGYNGFPFIYDHFMVGSNGKNITDQTAFPATANNSGVFATTALKNQYTSGGLTFSGPYANKASKGVPIKLYSPASYEQGSSISHLDEVTYPPSDPNTLMTPSAGSQEVTHDPGPITLGMLADMGWRSSTIVHDNLRDSEDITKNWDFNAKFLGDTTLVKGSLKLFMSTTGNITGATEVPLTAIAGKTNEFNYTLPPNGKERVIQYYFSGKDNDGRDLRTPVSPYYFQFTVGADTVKPQLSYFPTTRYAFVGQTLSFFSQATDNIEVDNVTFDYQIDGKAQTPIVSSIVTLQGTQYYRATVNLANLNLKGGEKLKYRIIATDKTKGKNTRMSPTTGYYEIPVLNLQSTVNTYKTDFNSASSLFNDFYLDGFDVSQATGFSTGSLNSEHPYQLGSQYTSGGENYSDFTAVLLRPVTVAAKKDSAIITFDEIALVEPGEDGSVYGDNDFYDYVVVEASKDGQFWYELSDGWDARDDNNWLTTFNSNVDSKGNSLAVGKPSLAKKRTINLLDSGDFKSGDKIILRFHLFSDSGAYGWGWWIDNLYIQTAAPVITTPLATENPAEKNEVNIHPNPIGSGEFTIEANFEKAASKVGISMKNAAGQEIYTQDFDNSGTTFSQKVNVGKLPIGIYYIQVQTNDAKVVKRVGVLR